MDRKSPMVPPGPAKSRRGVIPLSDQAYQAIEEKIVANEFLPGKVLSEGGLAELLGMGRTPIREALQRLANEGLVQILPQRGILVSDITVDDYLRLMEARRPLDILVADLASIRASEDQRMLISEIAMQFHHAQKAADERLFMKVDRKFNAVLTAVADNPYISRMASLLQGQSRRFYFRHHRNADFGETTGLHARLAEAVASGNREEAKDAAAGIISFNIRFAHEVLLSRR